MNQKTTLSVLAAALMFAGLAIRRAVGHRRG